MLLPDEVEFGLAEAVTPGAPGGGTFGKGNHHPMRDQWQGGRLLIRLDTD